MNALQPLSFGKVLIVGAKSSNFDDELMSNPRVILWSSQEEHWSDKELPVNVRAVFITRWIGHAAFNKIQTEAKKKRITIFNPMGTGIIAKQVRELLATPRINEEQADNRFIRKQEETMAVEQPTPPINNQKGKLAPLVQFIDYNKSNVANARIMRVEAEKRGITTTVGSLCQMITVLRRQQGIPLLTFKAKAKPKPSSESKLDISVAVLDEAIKQLSDVRDYLISTARENTELKARVAKLRKTLED